MPDAATAHPHRTPRRLLKRTLLLLALGTATTIFIAGTLSALASHWAPDRVAKRVPTSTAVAVQSEWRQDFPGVLVHSRSDPANPLRTPTSITLHADWVAGWPRPALRGRLTPASLADTQRIQIREGMLRFRDSTARISIGDGLWLTGHLFPLIPMWPGFLINTAIYAAAWVASLAIIAKIRRAHRTRRGQCPACKYDLRNTPTNAPCPECGRAR